VLARSPSSILAHISRLPELAAHPLLFTISTNTPPSSLSSLVSALSSFSSVGNVGRLSAASQGRRDEYFQKTLQFINLSRRAYMNSSFPTQRGSSLSLRWMLTIAFVARRIPPLHIFEKTVAKFGTFVLLYPNTETFILPYTHPSPEKYF
jgi:hypothetical protein